MSFACAPVAGVRLGVLADDLTGAHASASRLLAAGSRTVVIWDPRQMPRSLDAVVVNMRSRDDAGSGRERARQWAEVLRSYGYGTFELRIDTMLRGDSEPELEGLVEGAGLVDPLMVAIPAYPEAGRTTVDGMQHVACSDVEPVDAGRAIFGNKGWRRIDLATVRSGPEAIIERAEASERSGQPRLVVDSAEVSDLRACAVAISALRSKGHQVVTLSPGAWLSFLPCEAARSFVLVVVASPTLQNLQQLRRLRELGACVTTPGQVMTGEHPDISSVADLVVIETVSTSGGENRRAVEAAARAARALLDGCEAVPRRCRGVIVTGGEAANHVLGALEALTLGPCAEVRPLCVAGRIGGGPWSGLPFITKGGVIGDARALEELYRCLSTGGAAP